MADFAVKFADGGDQYTFTYIQRWNPGMGNAVNATVRAAGLSGGVDQFGGDDAPDAVKSIHLSLVLWADTTAEMQAKRDALNALKTLGTQKLYWQPQGSLNERWCYARVNSVRMSQDRKGQGDLSQQAQVTLHVAEPRWYETEESAVINAVGSSTEDTITNAGNAPALCRIVIEPQAGDSAQNPLVWRLIVGALQDAVHYYGTLTALETVTIDAEIKSIDLDGDDVYSDLYVYRPRWFVLLPGSNTIRVKLANPSDEAQVTICWKDTYR